VTRVEPFDRVRLKRVRLAAGLSQSEIADLVRQRDPILKTIGVTISRYEMGWHQPTGHSRLVLEAVLKELESAAS